MMANPSVSMPHVLILGAGLGGLTLAQSLRKRGISYQMFERDQNSDGRLQGWAIALHTMLDDFHASMPPDMPPFSQVNHLLPLELPPEIAMYTPESNIKVGGRDDGTGKFIRANRARLREWLSTNIAIQYDKKAISIEENDELVTVHFQDGSSATGDIVVGADGVRSMTRGHIFRDQADPLRKHKTATINGELRFQGAAFAEQLALGHSSYVLEFEKDGQRHHLFVGLNQVAPDGQSGDYYWNLMWPCEEADRDDHWTHHRDRRELYQHARRVTKDLPPRFRAAVEGTSAERIKLPGVHFHTLLIDKLPVGRVTLLGDAAHAMTPFRGEGGCHAMQDALNLARAVEEMDKDDLPSIKALLGAYQEEMLARGGRAARLSDKQFEQEMDPTSRVVAGRPLQVLPQETIVI